AMVAAVAEIRSTGVPVALVSNALGSTLYDGVDLAEIADSAVISAEIGVRKPSRQIYRVACERLGVAPEVALMVDDLQQNLDGAERIGIRGILHTDAATTITELSRAFDIELSTTPVEHTSTSHEGR
ncbi:MAG TPA: HAD-IA family hydrolase, partial [Dietzia timorensis]